MQPSRGQLDCLQDEESNKCFGDDAPSNQNGERKRSNKVVNRLFNIFQESLGNRGIFGHDHDQALQNAKDLLEKLVLRCNDMSLTSKNFEDSTEDHFQHFLKLRYKDLPFSALSEQAAYSTAVIENLIRFAESISDMNYHVGSVAEDVTASEEVQKSARGTLRRAVIDSEKQVHTWYDISKTAQQNVIKNTVEPLKMLKDAHDTIVRVVNEKYDSSEETVSALEAQQTKLMEALVKRQEKWAGLVRDMEIQTEGGRFRSNSADLETVEMLERELNEIRESLADLNAQIETAIASKKATHLYGSQTLEILDRSRITVIKTCMQMLIEGQLKALKCQQKSLEIALESVSKISSSSDVRTFANHEQIKFYLKSKPEDELQKLDSENELSKLEETNQAISLVFSESERFSERKDQILKLCERCGDQAIRNSICKCLNRYRSKKTDVAKIFDDLTLLFIGMLDQAYIQADIKSARMILILSETFYCISDDGNKLYIQDKIKGHAMWKAVAFWEEAFYQSVQEEISRNWALKTDGERALLMSTFKNLVYGQIGSCAFSMVSCGIDRSVVVLFIDRLCAANELNENQKEDLLRSIEYQCEKS